jgi:hypothetical protein
MGVIITLLYHPHGGHASLASPPLAIGLGSRGRLARCLGARNKVTPDSLSSVSIRDECDVSRWRRRPRRLIRRATDYSQSNQTIPSIDLGF